MIKYELAIVEDFDKFWKVVGVTKSSLNNESDHEQHTIKLSSMAYEIIKDAIHQKLNVVIPKTLSVSEVLPGDVIIKDQTDDIESYRESSIIEAKSLITNELAEVSGYDMYNFVCKNNELINKGYAVCDSNRENMYIKIIESGDETLITLLESFLNSKDAIDQRASVNVTFDAFVKRINNSQTIEDIDVSLNAFKSKLIGTIM